MKTSKPKAAVVTEAPTRPSAATGVQNATQNLKANIARAAGGRQPGAATAPAAAPAGGAPRAAAPAAAPAGGAGGGGSLSGGSVTGALAKVAQGAGATDLAGNLNAYSKAEQIPQGAPGGFGSFSPAGGAGAGGQGGSQAQGGRGGGASGGQAQGGGTFGNPQQIASEWEAYKKSNPVTSDVEAMRVAIKNMLFNMGSTKVNATTVERFNRKVLGKRKITNEDFRRLPLSRRRLYEGKTESAIRTMILGESLGRALLEFTLTSDQIQQIYPAAETGMDELSQQGVANNRTLIGKGKDVYDKVEKFVDDLVASAKKTKFVGDFDQKSQEALMQLDANGQQVLKPWIAKYRQFAQDHPRLQNLFYTVLVGCGGLAIGLGTGGAGALILIPLFNGLTKCLDRYLQGDEASSAFGKGVATGLKTALLGWLTREVKDLITNPPPTPPKPGVIVPPPPPPPGSIYHVAPGDNLSTIAQNNHVSVEQLISANQSALQQAGYNAANPNNLPVNIDLSIPAPTGAATYAGGIGAQATTNAGIAAGQMPGSFNPRLDQSYVNPRPALTEAAIGAIFYRIELRQRAKALVNEAGMWDSIKKTVGGAAKGVADWGEKKLHDAGRHMTTIVTANKLKSAWKKAGQPTDSNEFIEFLVANEVHRPLAEKLVNQFDPGGQQQGGAGAGGNGLFSSARDLEVAWQQYKQGGGKFSPAIREAFKAIWLDPWWSSVISTAKDGGTNAPTQMADPSAAPTPAPQGVNPMAAQDPNAAYQTPAQPYQKKNFNFNSKINAGNALLEELLFGDIPLNEDKAFKAVRLQNKATKLKSMVETRKMAINKLKRDDSK